MGDVIKKKKANSLYFVINFNDVEMIVFYLSSKHKCWFVERLYDGQMCLEEIIWSNGERHASKMLQTTP